MLDAGTAFVEAELVDAGPEPAGRGVGAGRVVGPTIVDHRYSGELLISAAQAVDRIVDLEQRLRTIHAEQIALLEQIDASGVAAQHGHGSAKIMMAHVAKLSGPEAAGREKTRRMLDRCVLLAEVASAGGVGIDQLRLLARVFTNGRVRSAFIESQQWFIDKANQLSFKRFERVIARWVEIHDDDGTDPNDRAHHDRNAAIVQDHFTKTWHLTAHGPALAGAQMREVLQAYIAAEYDKDHAAAKALFGEQVSKDQFARTDNQRRFDAIHQIFLDAASNSRPSAPAATVHNIVWDHKTFAEMVRRYSGIAASPLDVDTTVCATIDGDPLDPAEAFNDALTSHVRRVVTNARGVVIDMSHKARLFTGLARTAARISHDECEWIGCHVPASQCQIDHIVAHHNRGPTSQTNAAILCRKHNRHKERGYTVTRGPTGTLQITTAAGETLR